MANIWISHPTSLLNQMYETKCYMSFVLTEIQVSTMEGMEVIVEHHHPSFVWLYNANDYVTKLVTQT